MIPLVRPKASLNGCLMFFFGGWWGRGNLQYSKIRITFAIIRERPALNMDTTDGQNQTSTPRQTLLWSKYHSLTHYSKQMNGYFPFHDR